MKGRPCGNAGVDFLPSFWWCCGVWYVDLIENHGINLQMPHSRAMGGGLFELRPKGSEGIARVFYCTQIEQTIVVLHSFVKKTNTTPTDDLNIAKKRLKEVKNG